MEYPLSQIESIIFLAYFCCKKEGIDPVNNPVLISEVSRFSRSKDNLNIESYVKQFDELIEGNEPDQLIKNAVFAIEDKLLKKAFVYILECLYSIQSASIGTSYYLDKIAQRMQVPYTLRHNAETVFQAKYR